jgi:hypothetical protein
VLTVPSVFTATSVCALSTPDVKRVAAAQVFIIELIRKWKDTKLELTPRMGNTMPNDSHQRAAEFHELAAHAHRVAATHHSKEDHQTGHEHSKQALEHAHKAFEWSQEAHRKSVKSAGKS